MKHVPVYVLLVILLSFSVFNIHAENDSVNFVIAPPPVGYPEIEKGDKTRQAGGDLLFLTMDVMDEQVMIFGATAFGNYQESFTDWFSASLSLGGSFLAGNKHSLMIFSVPLHINGILEVIDTEKYSLYLFGGAGGGVSMSMMTVTIPQLVPLTSTWIDDDTSLNTTSINGTIHGGAQLNITTKNFIFSPFGSFSYSGGTYSSTQTSTMSYEYPATSGSIENYSSTVFGFDVLYRPKDIALSSQLRITDSYTMVSVAMKWLLHKS